MARLTSMKQLTAGLSRMELRPQPSGRGATGRNEAMRIGAASRAPLY
jgi:hypothetical protein